MKKLILASITSLLLGTTYSSAGWVKPTKTVCTSNGGKLDNGICKVNWKNAKDICQASGARLPTVNELKKVIISCGGGDDYDNNMNNSDYQSCYQRRGFSNKDWYWSSTEYNNDSSGAQLVNFHDGNGYWLSKSYESYFLCVR
jgi:hypothetical protein